MCKAKIHGQNMEPLLIDGDTIFVEKINLGKIEIDDIIFFKKNGEKKAHRLVYRKNKFIITKADALNQSSKVYEQEIIGKVTKVKRGEHIFRISDLYLYQSAVYFKEILSVKRFFDRNKIEFAILKGLPLSIYINGSIPKRVYYDCDILIFKTQYEKVSKIFKKLGYKYENPSLSDIQKGLRFKNTEVRFTKRVGDLLIVWDVHFEIKFTMSHLRNINKLYPGRFTSQLTKLFLNQKMNISVQEKLFPVLSRENLFIYLLLHLFRHNFKGYHRFEFIVKSLESNMNYDDIAKKLKKYKLINFVYPGLLFLERYYDVRFPRSFVAEIELDRKDLYYVKRWLLNRNLFDGESRLETASIRLLNLFLLSPGGFIKKVNILFNPKVFFALMRSIMVR